MFLRILLYFFTELKNIIHPNRIETKFFLDFYENEALYHFFYETIQVCSRDAHLVFMEFFLELFDFKTLFLSEYIDDGVLYRFGREDGVHSLSFMNLNY